MMDQLKIRFQNVSACNNEIPLRFKIIVFILVTLIF